MGTFFGVVLLGGLVFWAGYMVGRQKRSEDQFKEDWANKDAFKSHYSLALRPDPDRAPRTYVIVGCRACGAPVDVPFKIIEEFVKGLLTVRLQPDLINLEGHLLSCPRRESTVES